MRITVPMMSQQFLRNLSSIRERLEEAQNQITTGRRFNRPEDDPIGVARAMNFQTMLDTIGQHLRNIDEAQAWLGASESALNSATSLVHRLRDLTLQASNDTLSTEDRLAVQSELEQIKEQLVGIANSTYGGRYLFGGQATESEPWSIVGGTVVYSGDSGAILREIGVNATIAVNIPGSNAFGPVFQVIEDVITSVSGGANPTVHLNAVDNALDAVLTARAQVGAKMNRLEDQRERLKSVETDTLQVKSNLEDVDYAEAVTDYATNELVYRAALQMGAKSIQPTLLDYLR